MKIAFIGCGTIVADRHAPEATLHPEIEIAGFFNRTPMHAQALAQKYGGKVFDSVEQLLACKEINAVVVSSVNSLHYEHCMAALRSGKHVLCEKPIAITVADALEMTAEAERQGLVFMTAHNLRLEPTFIAAKKILDGGELGRIISFTFLVGSEGPEYERACDCDNLWFYDKTIAGLGVLGDLGVHAIDTLHYLLGERFDEVSCISVTSDKKLRNGSPVSVEDNASMILKTKSGITGTLTSSFSFYDGWTSLVHIYCQRAALKLYAHPVYPIVIKRFDAEEKLLHPEDLGMTACDSGIMRQFAEAVLHGTPPQTGGAEGTAALEVVLAALDSSQKHVSVKL